MSSARSRDARKRAEEAALVDALLRQTGHRARRAPVQEHVQAPPVRVQRRVQKPVPKRQPARVATGTYYAHDPEESEEDVEDPEYSEQIEEEYHRAVPRPALANQRYPHERDVAPGEDSGEEPEEADETITYEDPEY